MYIIDPIEPAASLAVSVLKCLKLSIAANVSFINVTAANTLKKTERTFLSRFLANTLLYNAILNNVTNAGMKHA